MFAVDTNVLVRLLVRDDVKQASAADQLVAKGAWISHLVLAEHESLVLEDAETVRLALTHYQRKPALGFSDCLVLEIARKAGCLPLGTFDRALAKLEGTQKL